MTFNVEKAKAAGYSDKQIEGYLAKNSGPRKFNAEKAKKAGYSDEEIEKYLADQNAPKAFGREGTIVGGMVGSLINNPVQALKEIPTAITQGLEFPVTQAPEQIAGIASQFLGQPSKPPERETFLSQLKPPEKTKIASELLADYAREGLTPEQREEAQDIADLETMLLPLFKKVISRRVRGPKAPNAPEGPSLPPRAPFDEGAGPGPKIAESLKKTGKEAKKEIFGPNLSEEIPKAMSAEKIKNTTSAGMELEKAVAKPYEELSAQENKAYEVSKKANKAIESIHPELVSDLQASLEELEKIPDPSAPMKRYIISSRKLLRELAERDQAGAIHGYKPISNQTLINQIQEYNQIPQFDFPTDTKTGIFKSLIRKLTEAVDRTALKHPEANAAWQRAKEIHSRKSDLFADRDVSKWTKLADKNYSKEFQSSIDIDKIRKMQPVLEMTPEGRDILQKLKRELVERMFEEYFPVGRRFDKKEIAQALSELEPILTKDELRVIEELFKEAQTPGAKAAALVDKFYRYIKRPTSAIKELGKIK